MITPEECDRLDEWRQYFVYGEDEDNGIYIKGLKKSTPKKVLKEFKEWYKATYPPIENDEDAKKVPNI